MTHDRVKLAGNSPVHGVAVTDLSTGKVYPLAAGAPVKLQITASGFLVHHA